MSEYTEYSSAVAAIKTAILQSQYDAAKAANETQLMLYFGIGKYISHNSRKGFWGKPNRSGCFLCFIIAKLIV